MKLSEFIVLDENAKKLAVLHKGVLIAKRNHFESLVFLFQLNAYYVEAFCNPKNKSIEEYRVFDNLQTLHPYLETIALDDLINHG
jgi:hypothetical protein